jgi:hypothetical protein
MFFDYTDKEDEIKVKPIPKRPEWLVKPQPSEEKSKPKGKWRRVERRIYSRFWRAIHNLIAHPMLAIYRPWGEKLHKWTEDKMYTPKGNLPPIISDKD